MAVIKSFHQGEDVNFDVTVYSDEALTVLKDVTGGAVVGRLGISETPSTSVETAGSVVDGPGGVIRVPVTSAQSAALAAAVYDFQAELTLGGLRGVVTDYRLLLQAPTAAALV